MYIFGLQILFCKYKMYEKSFYIEGKKGNNIFSYDERVSKVLFIPSLITGSLENVEPGTEIVFEEVEDGKIISCTGLKNFVETKVFGNIPMYIFDNHNHALYFWWKGIREGDFPFGLPLIHVDQHRDMREPETWLSKIEIVTEENIWKYTNYETNVGNFIQPAIKSGLISEVIFFEKSSDFETFPDIKEPFILDIDLDIFAPHMEYMDFDKIIATVRFLAKKASMITIATSPFFIDQERAIKYMNQIFKK